MNNPSGYTALDLVGFTDRGTYDPNYNYVANDLAHHGGSIWCCLIDDTMGIEPTGGVNWRFWVEDSQNGISDIVNKLGAKNLLKIEANNTTSSSVSLTVNNDGSLTINGTATPSNAYFVIMNHDFGNYRFATDGRSDANAQYILSGLPTDPYLYMAYDVPNKRVALVLLSGHTADNVTFYPMIRPKGIEDDTWQPYSKTNQELTEEVTQNSSDIQTLSNKIKKVDLGDILIIFDSYGTTYANDSGDNTTIPSVMQTLTDRTIRSISVSGGGFVRDTGNGTFYSNLVTYLSSLTSNDKSKITDIVVAAGRNDWPATATNLETAINAFYSYAESNLPNLTRKCFGYIANGDDNSTHGTKYQQYACYMNFYNICNTLNIRWLSNVDCVLHNYDLLASDGVHPTSDGKKELAKALIQAIEDGYTATFPLKEVTVTAANGVTVTTGYGGQLYGQMLNNIASLKFPKFIDCTLDNAIDDALQIIQLFSVDNGYIKYPYNNIVLPCNVLYVKDNILTPLAGRVILDHDGMVRYQCYVPYGNRTDNITRLILSGCGEVNIPAANG